MKRNVKEDREILKAQGKHLYQKPGSETFPNGPIKTVLNR